VTPITAIERTPTTSYDEDIYDPKAGDTYESISRDFYNDTKYATALRTYNRNKPLQGSGQILIPPLGVLGRTSPSTPPTIGMPVSQAGGTPEWGSAPPSTTVRAGEKTFRVPTGGMTMKAIARLTLNNEQRWQDIYTLNPQHRPDERLPAGTDIRLPTDARIP
jgi:hypothetical protein